MSVIRVWQVDAFTKHAFAGNPAAVCWLEEDVSDDWMQAVAAEMNLSETAFVQPYEDGYRLRWFTPAIEVDLCGHATLATSHVLLNEQIHPADKPLRFHTKSRVLVCEPNEDGSIGMDFPATPPSVAEPSDGLLEALGVSAVWCGESRFDRIVVLADETTLTGLTPDFGALAKVSVRGTMVTCRAERPGCDYVSRFFAPAVGINEDPVTGSAHCCLAPYWTEQLGESCLTGFQASSRGGKVVTEVRGDRVILTGHATTVLTGNLRISQNFSPA